MERRNTKVGGNKSEVVKAIPNVCSNEQVAVEFMERQRWGNTVACPRCGDCSVAQMKDKEGNRNKRFLWRCYGCKKQFTVRVGTVMEDSPIPIRFWCLAFYRAAASKKGVSALQIQRETGLSYKSALFLMHRIRLAMTESAPDMLGGIVEIDETIVGGKRKAGRKDGKIQRKRSRENKTQVLAMVERDGNVRTSIIPNRAAATLTPIVSSAVKPSARVMTDEWLGYHNIKAICASHETVNHSEEEYAREDVTTNTVEGFFALLQRGIYGTFHSVTKRHLHRYLSEFEFRYNHRKLDDGARMVAAIQAADGKRLTYKEQTGKSVTSSDSIDSMEGHQA
jgi:transposase-like protein